MTHTENSAGTEGPEGSIFLFEPLSTQEFGTVKSKMLLGRGEFRDMDPGEIAARYEDMVLRRAITQRLGAVARSMSI